MWFKSREQSRAVLGEGLLKLIGKQFLDYWPYYLAAIFCLYMTHWIQSYLPFLAKELAEKVTESLDEISLSQFAWLAIGIIIFRTGSRLLFFYPARILQRHLRVELVERLESQSPYRYSIFSPGQMFQVIGNDMEELRALVGFALLQVGNILIAMIVLLPKLFEFNPSLVVALIPMFVAFVIFASIVSRSRYYYRKTQDAQGDVQNFIMESYSGKKTIKNYHAEKSFIALFDRESWKELWYFYRAGIGVAFSIPLVPLGVGVSLVWGAHIIVTQDLGTSSLVLFSGFVFLFLEPLTFLSWLGIVITRSIGAWNRIDELVHRVSEESYRENYLKEKNTDKFSQAESFHVCVEFWEKDLKLDFAKGKSTVLVSSTGEGKTEIIKQLAEIFRQKNYALSYVAQDPYLYNDTIENNIFLGETPDLRASDRKQQAIDLLKLFGLDFLEEDSEKLLKMEVGENGKRLSGGQAKRVCLVRSLMANAEILIWDDPFSSVDVILERQIFDRLKEMKLLEGKTLILSSHRLTTVKLCDHMIYLGKNMGVKEAGETSELLMKGTATYGHFEDQMV